MFTIDRYQTVSDAAAAIGVSEPMILKWIRQGDIAAAKLGGRWLIDVTSVARRSSSMRAAGRPYAAGNAWSVVALASGDEARWLEPAERYRFRRALDRQGLSGVAPKLSRRDRQRFFRAHPGALDRFAHAPETLPSGVQAAMDAKLGIVGSPRYVELRVSDARVESLVREFSLSEADETDANVRLRVVAASAWQIARGCDARAVAALDLFEEPDARSRREGQRVLNEIDRERRWLVQR